MPLGTGSRAPWDRSPSDSAKGGPESAATRASRKASSRRSSAASVTTYHSARATTHGARRRRKSGRSRLRKKIDRWVIAIILGLVVFALAPPPGLDLLGIGQRFNGKLPPWLGGPSPSTMETLPPSELATMLRELPVRTHSARDEGAPDYDRQAFGQRWADEDHNGCDTRNDILARDLSRPAFRENSKCVVVGGSLAEPYTGSVVEFQRGEKTSELVQIDHVVSLSDAWWSGAWTWDAPTRQRFANDPANLLAVDGKTNEDKGAASADRWLPPNREFHCEYVSTQIRVKHAWALSVSEAEREAMAQVLSTCPVPQSGGEQ